MLLEEVIIIFQHSTICLENSHVITLAVSCFEKKSKLFTGQNRRVGICLSPFMVLLRWEWPLSEQIMFKHQNNDLDHFLTKPWSAFDGEGSTWTTAVLSVNTELLSASFSSAYWMSHFLLAQCSNNGVWLTWRCSVTLPPCGHCTAINVVRIRLSVDIADFQRILLNATVTLILLIQGQWMALLGKEKVYTSVFPPSSFVQT